MEELSNVIHKYLRTKKKFPSVWCAGCGIGIVMGALIRAIDRLNLDKDEIVMISGIGCSSRLPVYVDFNTLHTTHGRALAFATGVKFARPDFKVIVVMGDGDALAIGGNHFIHAARRNIDLTAIIINNCGYSMTGGQYSPTTPQGHYATTAPYGNLEQAFDLCELAKASGAVFVARSTVYHAVELDRLIEKAIVKEGFSVVEAISHCHTIYGRMNKMGSAVDMMRWQKEHAIPIKAAAKMSKEQLKDKFLTGVLFEKEAPEYTEIYKEIIAKAKAKVVTEKPLKVKE